MREFQLPATDLTFGQKCKCCLWAKHHQRWREPNKNLPKIFNQIDKKQKAFWSGRSLNGLEKHLPDAALTPYSKKLASQPIVYHDLDVSLTLTGFLDLYGKGDSGWVIGDSKTVPLPKTAIEAQALATLYSPQLHLYRFAAMYPKDPAKFQLGQVTALGLLLMGVGEIMELDLGMGPVFYAMEAPHLWLPIPIDDEGFTALLRSTAELLAGPQPKPNLEECHWCELRELRRLVAQSRRQQELSEVENEAV